MKKQAQQRKDEEHVVVLQDSLPLVLRQRPHSLFEPLDPATPCKQGEKFARVEKDPQTQYYVQIDSKRTEATLNGSVKEWLRLKT